MSQRFPHYDEHEDANMMKVEVNLDDTPPEWLGYVMDKLFEMGANDVYYIPIFMKKNRPGILLQLLCDQSKLDSLKDVLFKETTTLGLRYYPLSVHRLERRFQTLTTPWGDIQIKEGLHNGEVMQRSPEYDECKRIAEQNDIPLKDVYNRIWQLLS